MEPITASLLASGIGSALSASATAYSGWKQYQSAKDQNKTAQESLNFAKEQYQDQKQNYDNYMQDTNASASTFNTIKRKSTDSTMPMAKL